MTRHSFIIPFRDIEKAGLFQLQRGEYVADESIQIDDTGKILCISVEHSDELEDYVNRKGDDCEEIIRGMGSPGGR